MIKAVVLFFTHIYCCIAIPLTSVNVILASRVMYSAYLQANIPQSLRFICWGMSYNENTTYLTRLVSM
jgi:hypothetical protein